MALKEVTPEEYARLFADVPTCFDTAKFAEINRMRAGQIRCLTGHGLGIIVGLKDDGMWHAPFSAPYASVSGAGDYDRFAADLVRETGGRLVLTLPALIYGSEAAEKVFRPLAREIIEDYNYHYDLRLFDDYEAHLSQMARRNFHRSMKSAFLLEKTDDISGVYALIADHHRRLGYHMAMTEADVRRTTEAVEMDFFKVFLGDKTAGAAIYYRTAPGVAQLINWGDNLELRSLRVMPFMAHSIFGFYHSLGFHIIDMGPSSTDGIKNEGLVNFKLSLGCTETAKVTLVY